jgi:hypothetical protein
MIISGSYLIPFDQVNQQYLENARSIGKSRIEVSYFLLFNFAAAARFLFQIAN